LQPSPKLKIEALLPSSSPSSPDIEPTKQPRGALEASSHEDSRPTKPARTHIRPSVKAGSKRKFGDENDEVQAPRAFPSAEKPGSEIVTDRPLIIKDWKDRSSAKDSSSRPEEKSSETKDPTKTRSRQPLADKSRNDGIVSPKKLPKSATTGDLMKVMMGPPKETSLKAAPLKKKRVVPIKLPSLPPPGPPAANQPAEPETPSADPGVVFPDTPETKSTSEKPKDTPPPADISSHGETSRPSRRVRASVSYAEPNLRDKMRRPTKDLLDAVSGEGKYKRNSSAQHATSASTLKPTADGELSRPASTPQLPAAHVAMEDEAARRPSVTSPLLKDPVKEVPAAGQGGQSVTERRRRPSSRQSQLVDTLEKTEDDLNEAEDAKESYTIDPYEFRDESTILEQAKEFQPKGRGSKGARRSTVTKSAGTDEPLVAGTDTRKPSRKRASMAAPKKSSMLDDEQDEDSSYDASLETVRDISSSLLQDKASRRRSMML
jgi:hypothetical protein